VEVRLRPLRREDLPLLYGWYQAPELWTHLLRDFTPRREDEALSYMERWLSPGETELRSGIEVTDGSGPTLVGIAFFSPLDRARGEAELHIMIGDPAERGRGVGRQAVAALLETGFGLGLQRIYLKVLETNAAARRVYEVCGFRVVGRDAPAVKDGRNVGVLVMQADQPSATT
jgi:RimJ/RimL family protein N-acetyltransferase